MSDPPVFTAVMVEPAKAAEHPILEVHHMTAEQPRPLPHSTFQLIGQTTQDVVGGVTKTPLMLGVILLNVVGIAAAVYFLNLLISGQQQHLGNLLTMQTGNMNVILETHNREFDALMAMNAKVTEALAAERALPATTPALPPVTTTPPVRGR